MTSKRSAFSVFKEKPKKSSSLDIPEAGLLADKQKSKLENANQHLVSNLEDSCPSTPKLENATIKGIKSEPRFSSLRKSLRKKPKKESHHDVDLKHDGKENKLAKAGSYLQIFERSNWTESLQSLNSSSLEEAFLPEVAKQKKEQKELHGYPDLQKEQLRSSSASEITSNIDQANRRKRSNSCANFEPSEKPPMPKKPKIHITKKTIPGKTDGSSESKKKLEIKPKSPKNDKKTVTTDAKESKQTKVNESKNTHAKRIKNHGHHTSTSPEKNDKVVQVEDKRQINADKLFAWIIAPIKPEQFFSEVWQKKPLFIKRRQPKYNSIWFSCKELDKILRQKNVQFTKNLDIAVYRNGQRETLNPDGRAFAPIVWKFYQDGCSIRLLNPQTFSKNVWHLSSKLQESFGCFVGSNLYLTPPGSQGFAPHYDDIEAFIIQLEGRKHWKLYAQRDVNELLPRYSSKNLSQEELGEPILDRVLEPGDTLYFPRGVIHQATTPDDSHSLHITLSFCQKLCWSDFMEKLVPMALQTAIEEDVEFRKALPLGFHDHVGVSYSEKPSSERTSFMKTVEQLMKKLVSYVSVDQAGDEVNELAMDWFLRDTKKPIHCKIIDSVLPSTVLDQMEEYLPPSLNTEETECTVFGNGAFWDGGAVRGKSNITLNSEVKLTRPGIVRLVSVEGVLQVHHTLENSRQYKETPMKIIEISLEFADAVEFLLLSSEYVVVKDTPLDDDDEKLELAMKFYDVGLLRTKVPLKQDSLI